MSRPRQSYRLRRENPHPSHPHRPRRLLQNLRRLARHPPLLLQNLPLPPRRRKLHLRQKKDLSLSITIS